MPDIENLRPRTSLDQFSTEELEVELNKRHGDVVRPLGWVSKRLGEYVQALIENEADGPYNAEVGAAVRKYGHTVLTFAWKSNFLYRLLYTDDGVRPTKCPTHKGRWSGYQLPPSSEWTPDPNSPNVLTFKPVCECQYGYDVTGWIKEKDDPTSDNSQG